LEAHLQRVFQTDDRFLFSDEGYRVSLMLQAQSVRKLLTFGLVGAFPLAVTFFGVLGIAVVWARDRMWVYAVLRALGATRWRVGIGAMSEPFAISCAGAVLGLLLAWLLCSGLHRAVGLEVAYNWRWFAAACATGVAAMIPPAAYIGIRAAFTSPAAALRE
jgi:ABC-type antimicrobial peptide transport system permease subunit